MSAAQDRRPGLRELAEAIAVRNPTWSPYACAAIAKSQWTLNAFERIKATTERQAAAEGCAL